MKKLTVAVIILLSISGAAMAQSDYLPYSYQFYQKLNPDLYSIYTREHTSIKSNYADDSLLKRGTDSVMGYGTGGRIRNRLLNEHLIQSLSGNNSFYADFMPDVYIGRDLSNNKTINQTTAGFQLGGSVSNKFSYNVAGYLSQGIFPSYESAYISEIGVIPGQAYAHVSGNGYSWSYITANLAYTPVKYLTISAGRDKTFVGDGYRSLLLSDYAKPYLFFKLMATLGNVKYMVLWANFDDPMNPTINNYTSNRTKWGAFHYLDWNVSNRLSFGFFDSIIWANTDDQGKPRGFELSYLNPIVFLRTTEASNGSPDNALLGFTGKFKVTNGVALYGQFALDEFESSRFFSSDGSSRNKYAWQLGIRGGNLFGVKNLSYLVESNNAKPYTYSERSVSQNYSGGSEPLTHPWGANFREGLVKLNYSYKRFDFSLEADFGRYGLDQNGLNYGKNIYENYEHPAGVIFYDPTSNNNESFGNYTGQGLTTNLTYFEGKAAYILNPKYNLRIELGGIYREEKSSAFDYNACIFTLGLRSSFRQVYNDLASFKAH